MSRRRAAHECPLPDTAELALRLRYWRQGEGLSLRGAAERTGVPVATLGRIENGGVPSLAHYRLLVDFLLRRHEQAT